MKRATFAERSLLCEVLGGFLTQLFQNSSGMRPILFSFNSSWSEWKHRDRSPTMHSHVYAPKQTHSTSDIVSLQGRLPAAKLGKHWQLKKKRERGEKVRKLRGNHCFKLCSSTFETHKLQAGGMHEYEAPDKELSQSHPQTRMLLITICQDGH